MPEQTITRSGAVLPVKVRTARVQHTCSDCGRPIEPGDQYELAMTPPHRMAEYDVPRWLAWRTHYPRHDGHRFLIGCDLAAAYREKAERERHTISGPHYDTVGHNPTLCLWEIPHCGPCWIRGEPAGEPMGEGRTRATGGE